MTEDSKKRCIYTIVSHLRRENIIRTKKNVRDD